ncbi:MAG: ribose 5-phosphate isomerase B [Alphaproteobacteria bacterium]|nr:ribose 5-phosphate isomerase B [Alphaproteobacteria bacterium]
MSQKTVSLGSDHRGFPLKSLFINALKEKGFQIVDVGPFSDARCDAGDFAQKLALDLREHPDHYGVLICGTGQVMAMTANRYRHIRAALCTNTTMVRLARQHNNANVLVLGAHIIGQEVALDCLDVFMTTDFLGDRYAARCDKLTSLGGL